MNVVLVLVLVLVVENIGRRYVGDVFAIFMRCDDLE